MNKPAATRAEVLQILEVFPNVDIGSIQRTLNDANGDVAEAMAVLAEDNKWEGTVDTKSSSNLDAFVIRERAAVTEPSHDYLAAAASFELGKGYSSEVFDLLSYDFPFLSKNTINAMLKKNSGRYTLARNCIHDIIVGKNPKDSPGRGKFNLFGNLLCFRTQKATVSKIDKSTPANGAVTDREIEEYDLLRAILVEGLLPKDMEELGKLKKPSGEKPSFPALTDPILKDEHFHFERRLQEWFKRVASRAATKWALEEGSAVQCSCCFDDVAFSECVPCKEKEHLVCKDCVVKYVENQVFGMGNLGIDKETKKLALELKCCHESGCNSGYPDKMLQEILPPKTWEKYSELQIKTQLQLAGLAGDVEMCPQCGYEAVVPETQNIFECPMEKCRFVSCRRCGKAAHIPFRCDEVRLDPHRRGGRLKIEEALSEAKIRKCPKCKKKFIKSDGCNHMTCACGASVCYVCQKIMRDSHFCSCGNPKNVGGKCLNCGKCRQYSNDDEDDAQAMRDAGIVAKEAFEKEVEKLSISAADLKLDVDEMMKGPK